jgi:hypothetical protein
MTMKNQSATRGFKPFYLAALAITGMFALVISSQAQLLVNDNWSGGSRANPVPPTYADNNGVSVTGTEADGNPESAWFASNAASLTVAGSGDLKATVPSTSLSIYSYFTQPTTPVSLTSAGQEMTVTMKFTPNGAIAVNTSQGFNLALFTTPNGGRNTADGSIPGLSYTNAYSMFMNMSSTLANGNSFQLRKWGLTSASNILGTSGNWNALANGGTQNNTGYSVGTQYTFVFDLTLTAGGLQINNSMSGGSVNNTGNMTVSYLDTSVTPASGGVTFDTFDLRMGGSTTGPSILDINQFEVNLIPEPSTLALVAAGLGLMVGMIRRRR